MSNLQDLTIFAGETRTLTLYARDPDNNVQDLTGKTVYWRVGYPLWIPDQMTPVLTKTGTVLDAAAGSFTVTLNPPDTMPYEGNFIHNAITITDGSLEWVNDIGDEIVFVTDSGADILWVNDYDDHNHVVTAGTLHIRRSVLLF